MTTPAAIVSFALEALAAAERREEAHRQQLRAARSELLRSRLALREEKQARLAAIAAAQAREEREADGRRHDRKAGTLSGELADADPRDDGYRLIKRPRVTAMPPEDL